MAPRARLACFLIVLVAVVAVFGIVPAKADDTIGTLSFADTEGRPIALDEPGMLYLVDFWALGCKPCMQEMPELERLAKEYEPGGRFKFVSVIYGGFQGKELASVANRYGISHPVFADPDDWFERLDINMYPTKLLIRDGKLLQRTRGGGAGAYTVWNRTIRSQLQDTSTSKQP